MYILSKIDPIGVEKGGGGAGTNSGFDGERGPVHAQFIMLSFHSSLPVATES